MISEEGNGWSEKGLEVLSTLDDKEYKPCWKNKFLSGCIYAQIECSELSDKLFKLDMDFSIIVCPCLNHLEYYLQTKVWKEI